MKVGAWIDLGPISLIWFARIWTIADGEIMRENIVIASPGGGEDDAEIVEIAGPFLLENIMPLSRPV